MGGFRCRERWRWCSLGLTVFFLIRDHRTIVEKREGIEIGYVFSAHNWSRNELQKPPAPLPSWYRPRRRRRRRPFPYLLLLLLFLRFPPRPNLNPWHFPRREMHAYLQHHRRLDLGAEFEAQA